MPLHKYINPPFNYTGSKFKLLPQIMHEFDYTKTILVDLFSGGGSIMYNSLGKYDQIIANDVIPQLMQIHYMLFHHPKYILKYTKEACDRISDQKTFNLARNFYNKHENTCHPAMLWALILTCNSNMIRFNKKGEFNQTYGQRNWNANTDKKVFDLLQHIKQFDKDAVVFLHKDFSDVPYEYEALNQLLSVKDRSAFYYIDPPYSNTHAGYNCFWSDEHEQQLYKYITKLDKYGHTFCISGVLSHDNKDSELLLKLLSDGFNCIEIETDYAKVQKIKREKTNEIIIKNF